ncbi:MAG: anti-sigma factor family protein [Candidatus Deferrimicrobiaceae bacterium]
MNCKELAYLLGDYLDGTMEEQLRGELDVHIEMCDSCTNFLNTYDKTRIICRQVRLSEIPEEFRERLRSFVIAKAREHHKGIEKYVALAAEERRKEVRSLLRAFREKRLSPPLSVLFDAHRNRCEICGAFIRALNGGEDPTSVPPEIEGHFAEFLDALPPGEEPYRS